MTQTDKTFITKIVAYYKGYGRHDLTWRKNITPYRILVSEIMLQQTQVVRVEEKFKVWMKLYPTLVKLKSASFKDILILWQGLGYQRRAKALYSIAQTYTKIPKTFEELCLLSGVGKYTASALCAFGYDTFTHPVLETNIRTVLVEEYHKNKVEIDDTLLYDDLLRLEKNPLVQKMGARHWYYALMDYGAHLKQNNISHNEKSRGYTKQPRYKGSVRELRAKILFAVTHSKKLPTDTRTSVVLQTLIKEGYIKKEKGHYSITN